MDYLNYWTLLSRFCARFAAVLSRPVLVQARILRSASLLTPIVQRTCWTTASFWVAVRCHSSGDERCASAKLVHHQRS